MGKGRIAEANRKVLRGIKNGTVEVVTGNDGVHRARPTDRKQVRRTFLGTRIFYNCPKCGKVLEFRRKKHRDICRHCGQKLDWHGYDEMCGVYIMIFDADEAFYWASQYAYFSGTTYDLDIEKWRLIYRQFPMIMFYPFPEGKAYGRFMRKAAVEATVITYF